jgi:hypothetical protein
VPDIRSGPIFIIESRWACIAGLMLVLLMPVMPFIVPLSIAMPWCRSLGRSSFALLQPAVASKANVMASEIPLMVCSRALGSVEIEVSW